MVVPCHDRLGHHHLTSMKAWMISQSDYDALFSKRYDRVRLPVSSPITSAFPKSTVGRLDHMSPFNDFRTVVFSRLQSFVDLQASEFAVTQVVPTARQPIDCQGQP
jgi:hypothetical protein